MTPIEPNPGSFVVINQMNPQSNQTGAEGLNSSAPAQLPKPLVKFYQGEPEALGSTQICIGVIFITFGIPLSAFPEIYYYVADPTVITGVLFWTGIMYIVSGSLSISASIKPTVRKVKTSLALNIVSSVFAFAAILSMAFSIPYHLYRSSNTFCVYYKPSQICEGEYMKSVFLTGIITTLFILSVLEFTISVSVSAFGCKTLCRTSYNETSVVIYQTVSSNVPSTTTAQPTDTLKI